MGVLLPFPKRSDHEPELPIVIAAGSIPCSKRTLERWIASGAPHTRTDAGHLRVVPSKVIEWRERLGREDHDDAA